MATPHDFTPNRRSGAGDGDVLYLGFNAQAGPWVFEEAQGLQVVLEGGASVVESEQ